MDRSYREVTLCGAAVADSSFCSSSYKAVSCIGSLSLSEEGQCVTREKILSSTLNEIVAELFNALLNKGQKEKSKE